MTYFIAADAWVSALVFAALMVIGWGVGVKLRSLSAEPAGASTRIEDGALALFGLLLAFCFSGASARYEARKDLLRDDVIAISEFATVGSLLEESESRELRQEIRKYVQLRLRFGTMRLDAPQLPGLLQEEHQSQDRMFAILKRVVVNKESPSVHTPLVNAFNGLTAAYDKRLAGVRDQVNANIVLMLVILGVFTTFTMGRLHDQNGRFGLLRISSYVGLVALVFFVIVDLEQPRRGLILVSQAPMLELEAALQAGAP